MFETLFTCPGALRRHQDSPLADERAAYLSELVDKGMARGTILRRASYCLCVAVEIQRWSPEQCFDRDEVEEIAQAWADQRFRCGRASSPRWPSEHFRFVAMDFLRFLGRLRPAPATEAGRYDAEMAEFLAAHRQERWLSEATCRSAKWQVTRFLEYLEQRGVALDDVGPTDVDAFFELMGQRWTRSSLRASAKMLRAWFRYCETQEWVRAGLADAILAPRVYRYEGLPLGPTWDAITKMLDRTRGDDPASTRDHAIILLLSVYGLRSGEVRRLRLDDIDWAQDRIRFVRSKSRRDETAPLEPRVGNAIARYLRRGRPETDSRIVFLTLRAPHRPLSQGGLYHAVESHLSGSEMPARGCGPHGLRHACARHLVESGLSFKEVGDHLGHRSPESTQIYAKVDLTSLRRVAFDDLGGLS